MKTIAVTLSDDCYSKLEEVGARFNVSQEELARMCVEELANAGEEDFQNAAEYVIGKNAELYRRLAQ